jgi:hypothetical protein
MFFVRKSFLNNQAELRGAEVFQAQQIFYAQRVNDTPLRS